jgi:protein-tyrosine-phosphatase
MILHLVCTGNTFRSRLAEAYVKSVFDKKGIKDITVVSSGINAEHNTHGPISWYALRILFNEGLVKYMAPSWTQTTKENIEKAGFVVFMTKWHYEQALSQYKAEPKNYVILDIEDVSPGQILYRKINHISADLEIMRQTEVVYREIKKKIDKLVETFH